MTITLTEHELSRSEPWENILYPMLRDPEHAKGYIEACFDDDNQDLLAHSLCEVIRANSDLPFIAYQVICAYSLHLKVDDIPRLIDTLQDIDQAHQAYLVDLYLWLDMLKTLLPHDLHWLKVEARPLDVPEELKASEAYQQWAKVA